MALGKKGEGGRGRKCKGEGKGRMSKVALETLSHLTLISAA